MVVTKILCNYKISACTCMCTMQLITGIAQVLTLPLLSDLIS